MYLTGAFRPSSLVDAEVGAGDEGGVMPERKSSRGPVVPGRRPAWQSDASQRVATSCQGSSVLPRSAARTASTRYVAGSTAWSFAVSKIV
jgi:hypothetical protein